MPKLTADQARKLHDAEVAHDQLKAQLDIAKKTRDELRGKYRPRLELAKDAAAALKGTLQAISGGIAVQATPSAGGETFSLKDYRTAGHKVTPEMQPFIKAGGTRWTWTVRSIAGPKRHDAATR